MSVGGLHSLSQELELPYPEFIRERVKFYGHKKSIDLSNLELKSIPNALFVIEDVYLLDLSNNLLSDLTNIEKISMLERINLAKNKFETVPNALITLPNINTLGIQNNRINNFFLSPEECPNLENINLSSNYLTNETILIQHQNLRRLFLNNNNFTKLPDITAPKMHHLELRHNKINGIYEKIIFPTLQVLDLSFNDIDVMKQGEVFDLPKLLQLLISITSLEVLFPDIIREMIEFPLVEIQIKDHKKFEELSKKLLAYCRLVGNKNKIHINEKILRISWNRTKFLR